MGYEYYDYRFDTMLDYYAADPFYIDLTCSSKNIDDRTTFKEIILVREEVRQSENIMSHDLINPVIFL